MIIQAFNTTMLFESVSIELVVWLSAVVLLLVTEAATSNLTTIWFAGGSLAGAILAAVGVGLEWQITAFIVISALLLTLTRPLVKRWRKNGAATNKDNLIGTKAYVFEEIDNIAQTGYIKIGDVYWSARSADDSVIAQGTLVKVKSINGNKLIVSLSENKK